MAMWVMDIVGEAPCECFSLGGNHATSPGGICSIGRLGCLLDYTLVRNANHTLFAFC
jgi:hypothetical protein